MTPVPKTRFLVILAVLSSPTWARGQTVTISGPDAVPEHKLIRLSVELKGAQQALWELPDGVDADVNGGTVVGTAAPGVYGFRVTVVDFDAKKIFAGKKSVTVGPAPPDPGPTPKPPGPNPPAPGPVTSFRVIYVYESSATYPAAVNSVLYGKDLEAFLTARTTKEGSYAGWRRRDKDDAATGDTAAFNALWGAVKPKVTAVPCWAIAVNDRVDILPLPATQAEAIATLKTYLGEK